MKKNNKVIEEIFEIFYIIDRGTHSQGSFFLGEK